jgi:hypothetical protein
MIVYNPHITDADLIRRSSRLSPDPFYLVHGVVFAILCLATVPPKLIPLPAVSDDT